MVAIQRPASKLGNTKSSAKVLPDLTKEQQSATVDLAPITTALNQQTDVQQDVSGVFATFSQDTEFVSDIQGIMEAPEKTKRGPCVLLLRSLQLGVDMSTFPVVGSRNVGGGSNNPLFDIKETLVRNAAGDLKPKAVSWYDGFIDKLLSSLPKNNDPLYHLAELDKADLVPPQGIYASLSANKPELKSTKGLYKGRRTSAKAAITKMVRVYHQMEMVNTMTNVGCKLVTFRKKGDENDELSATNEPVRIFEKGKDGGEAKNLGVGSFLSLKPPGSLLWDDNTKRFIPHPDAVTLDADLLALIKSAGRGADDGDQSEDNPDGDNGLIKSVPEMQGEIVRIQNFLDVPENLMRIEKALSGKGEASDTLLTALCDLYVDLKPFYDRHQSKYGDAVDRKTKAA